MSKLVSRRYITIILLLTTLAVVAGILVRQSLSSRTINADLGEVFTLHQGQTAQIKDMELGVTIKDFINSPCPQNATCIWSGQSVNLVYTYKGEPIERIHLLDTYGFRVNTEKSDYKTYANLRVEKIEEN